MVLLRYFVANLRKKGQPKMVHCKSVMNKRTRLTQPKVKQPHDKETYVLKSPSRFNHRRNQSTSEENTVEYKSPQQTK